jgi:hypothetical protein
MPNGSVSPDAKIEARAFPSSSARKTTMRPAALSATNTSPFGAVRINRGATNPEANRLTSKPFGTIGFWSSVRRAVLTELLADAARSGAGKSCGQINRRVPGWSVRQSPNAARPSRTPLPVCAKSETAGSVTKAAAQAAAIARIDRRMACSCRRLIEEPDAAVAVPRGDVQNGRSRGISSRPALRGGGHSERLELTLSFNFFPSVRPDVYSSIPSR